MAIEVRDGKVVVNDDKRIVPVVGFIQTLDQGFKISSEPLVRELFETLAEKYFQAVKQVSVYDTPRSLDYIIEYATTEKRNAFKEQLKNNATTLFNVGDPGPENSILFQFKSCAPNIEYVVLLVREDDAIFGYGYLQDGTSGTLMPLISDYNVGDPNIRISQITPLLAEAHRSGVPQEVAEHFGRMIFAACVYLNDMLPKDPKAEYVDGVRHMMLVVPDWAEGKFPEVAKNVIEKRP